MKPALFNMLTSRRRAKERRRIIPEESTFGGYSDHAVPQDCKDCDLLATIYTEGGAFCTEHYVAWANAG